MTDGAARLVELCIGTRMRFQKLRWMICRPEFRSGAVALLAAEGQLDLVVAYQAVGHLRKIRAAHRFGCVNAPMTGEARIGAVQVLANVAGRRKILNAIDRLCNHWRDVSKLQMLFMAEMREQRLGRLGNRDALMARPANSRRGQIVVFHARAMCDRCVTTGAIRFQLQMHAMRKRRSRGRRREKRTGKNELAQVSVKKSGRARPAPTDIDVSAAHSAGPLDYFTDTHAHRRGW